MEGPNIRIIKAISPPIGGFFFAEIQHPPKKKATVRVAKRRRTIGTERQGFIFRSDATAKVGIKYTHDLID